MPSSSAGSLGMICCSLSLHVSIPDNTLLPETKQLPVRQAKASCKPCTRIQWYRHSSRLGKWYSSAAVQGQGAYSYTDQRFLHFRS
uniref:Uncharacterized protein n=1 Tax=Zea mays TaxID=4577 RepID=C4IZL0_MAIZE|nr:unknown [Zea mays]